MTGSRTPLFAGDWVRTPDSQRGEVVGISRDGRWASIEGHSSRVSAELDGAAAWDAGEWPVHQLQLIERGQEGRWADEEAAEMSGSHRQASAEDKSDAA